MSTLSQESPTTSPPPPPRRRSPWLLVLAVALVVALLVAVGYAVLPRGGDEGPVERAAEAAPAAVPTLNWQPCGPGIECTLAPVPLDHDNPAAGTVELALTRIPATDPAAREGTVFVDAGVQAAGGTTFVAGLAAAGGAGLTERFDVIGIDARGTGAGSPGFRCLTYEQVRAAEAPIAATMTPADLQVKLAESQALVDGCVARSSELMPHMSSLDAARDLDLLRAAVGDEQLTYLGVSWGGLAGQYYAMLHPERVRAMVLDSAPSAREMAADPLLFDREQMASAEGAVESFLGWCAATPQACAFGGGDPVGAFDALVDRLEAARLADPANHALMTGGDLVVATVGAMIDPAGWPQLGAQLAAAEAMPVVTDPVTLTGDDPATGAVLGASCLDRAFPRDTAAHNAHLLAAQEIAPRLAGVYGYGGLKCALWPVDPNPAVTSWVPGTPVPALVVGGTADPLVPASSTTALAEDLGAATVTVDGPGHTAYGRGVPCVDAAVTGFLTQLQAPATDGCARPLPGG